MAAKLLIIDGYNLLHAAGWAQPSYRPGELEACRTRLLRFLNEQLSELEAVRTTVVFDARHPPIAAPRFITHGLVRVLFASPHGDADRTIEEMLESAENPRSVTLVSGDRRLQLAADAQHCHYVSSVEFIDSLQERQCRQSDVVAGLNLSEKPQAVTDASELNLWLRVFGDVSISAIAAQEAVSLSARKPAPTKSHPAPAATVSPKPAIQAPAKAKRPQQTSKKNAVKVLSADVNEWLAWASDVQAWLDELNQHPPKK